MIRKSGFAVVFVIGLVFAGTAFAKTYFYEGEGADDKKVQVSFDVIGPKGGKNFLKNARVEDFTIEGATQVATCGGQTVNLPVGYHFNRPINIDKNEDFAIKEHVKGNDQIASLKGSFRHFAFAQGRFRLSGDVGGCSVKTAVVLWDAATRHP